jgi:hypothetical protein
VYVSVVHNGLFVMSSSCCLGVFLTFIMPFVPVSIFSSKQQIKFLVFPFSIERTYFLAILKSKWIHVGHVIFNPPQFRFVFFIQIYKNSNSRLKFNWSFIKSQLIGRTMTHTPTQTKRNIDLKDNLTLFGR